MSENREETVRQFCDVTGADETRSKFFLESSNWRLEVSDCYSSVFARFLSRNYSIVLFTRALAKLIQFVILCVYRKQYPVSSSTVGTLRSLHPRRLSFRQSQISLIVTWNLHRTPHRRQDRERRSLTQILLLWTHCNWKKCLVMKKKV